MHRSSFFSFPFFSLTSGSPIEIAVAPEQMRFDLNDPRLISQVEYQIVVVAENSFGLGPPSNVVSYTRVEEGKGMQPVQTLHRSVQMLVAFNLFSIPINICTSYKQLCTLIVKSQLVVHLLQFSLYITMTYQE